MKSIGIDVDDGKKLSSSQCPSSYGTGTIGTVTVESSSNSVVMVSSPASSDFVAPDQVLAIFGSKNAYLIFIWISMGLVWGLNAMPMMISAFLMNEACSAADGVSSNCTLVDGTMEKEFNLVGGRRFLAGYTTSAFLIGVTTGSFFLPLLSDRLGRRAVLLMSMLCFGVFGCISGIAPEVYSFIVLRFAQGFFFTGCGITSWVLAYESIPRPLRAYTALVFGVMWVGGYCAVAPLDYLMRNWRHLVLAASGPNVLFTAIYYFTIPESFHFTVSSGDWPAVNRWLDNANRFALWSGTPRACLTANQLLRIVLVAAPPGAAPRRGVNATMKMFFGRWSTLRSRAFLLYTMMMTYLWFCDSFVYYGLSLFSTRLAGNRHWNFVLTGLIEIPSYLVSPLLLDRLGRRIFVSVCHALTALSFFIVVFTEAQPTLRLVMWLLGKFTISCSFTSLYVYASELFPTRIRNGCLGICEVMARIGGSLAPIVQALAILATFVPVVFFGACATLAAAATLALPETRNRELSADGDQDADDDR